MLENSDTVLNFSLFSYKTAKFQISGWKITWVGTLSVIVLHKINLGEKRLLKVLVSPQAHFQWNFSVSKSSVYKISQFFLLF